MGVPLLGLLAEVMADGDELGIPDVGVVVASFIDGAVDGAVDCAVSGIIIDSDKIGVVVDFVFSTGETVGDEAKLGVDDTPEEWLALTPNPAKISLESLSVYYGDPPILFLSKSKTV